MFKDYNKYRVLKIFLYNSTESFRLRELSRKVGLAPLSISNYLREFEKEEVIKSYNKDKIKFYIAQRDSRNFSRYQKLSVQYELYESGIIDGLWDELHPEAIILYGSYAKGEAIDTSDIDIFIICKEKTIALEEYEKKIGKKIHLMFQVGDKISKELKNNLVNGIVMKGYFKAV
jgi:predicted nucleotidyltransferase